MGRVSFLSAGHLGDAQAPEVVPCSCSKVWLEEGKNLSVAVRTRRPAYVNQLVCLGRRMLVDARE